MKEIFEKLEAAVTDIFLFLMFSVYLFGVSPEGYENISETKYLLFCILCGGYCGIMLILLLQKTVLCRAETSGSRWKQISWRDRGERTRICFTLFLFLYLALTAVSGVVSEYGAATLTGEARREGVLTISIYGFVCFFVMKSYRGRHRNVLCVFAAASVLLFDVICLLQLLNRNPLGLYPGDFTYADRYREYGGAFLGTTGNADLTSAFLSLMIPFFAVIFLRSQKKRSPASVLYAAAACFSAVILVWSGVLAGIAGTAVSLIVFLPAALGMNRKKSLGWYGAAMLLVALSLTSVYFFPSDGGAGSGEDGNAAVRQVEELQRALHGDLSDSAGSGRIHIYRQVWHLIEEKPFLGGGPDTLIFRETEGFRRYDSSRGKYIEAYIDTAHSEYLNIFVCQGLFALAAYLGALACGFFTAVRNRRRLWPAACGAAVFSYAVQACFGFSMYITAPYFWIFLGFLMTREEYGKRGNTEINGL